MGNKIMKNMYSRKYENIVEIYSQKYQVDPNLIFAIIKAESNFNSSAVSGKLKYGGWIEYDTLKKLRKEDKKKKEQKD